MKPPQMKDPAAWQLMLLEHRRILLERLIAEFPEVLKKKRSKVDHWRSILRTVSSIEGL